MSNTKSVCVDLDGTIAHYQGWRDEDHFGDPIDGVRDALGELRQLGWTVIVFTTRANRQKVEGYLKKHNIPYDDINRNKDQPANAIGGKVYADVYVDDRAIQFCGDWKVTLAEVLKFKPWEERSGDADSRGVDSEAVSFLARDFNETVAQMRHYDLLTWEITKFSFVELLVGFGAAWAVYAFAVGQNSLPILKTQWPLVVAAILIIGYLFSLLTAFMIVRSRLYYVLATRYVNEHRHFFLSRVPLGFPNASGFYTDFSRPQAYDPLSTQLVSVYVIALTGSTSLAVAVGVFASFMQASQQITVVAAGVALLLSAALIIVCSIAYLKRKSGKTANEAVFGTHITHPQD